MAHFVPYTSYMEYLRREPSPPRSQVNDYPLEPRNGPFKCESALTFIKSQPLPHSKPHQLGYNKEPANPVMGNIFSLFWESHETNKHAVI